jgi:hypothetical protein
MLLFNQDLLIERKKGERGGVPIRRSIRGGLIVKTPIKKRPEPVKDTLDDYVSSSSEDSESES